MMMDGADIVNAVKNKDINEARKHQGTINAAVVAITQYGIIWFIQEIVDCKYDLLKDVFFQEIG